MLTWIRSEIEAHRQRRTTNETSWEGVDRPGADGVTQFQVVVLRALRESPGVAEVEFVKGSNERYFKGKLLDGSREFYLYEDETQLSGAIYERWAFETRQRLTEEFLSNAARHI